LLASAMPKEPCKPGKRDREIAPPHVERSERIVEPARHLLPHARHSDRQAGRRGKRSGVAEGACLPCLERIHEGNAMTVALKPGAGARADDAGADDGYVHGCCRSGRRTVSVSSPGGRTSWHDRRLCGRRSAATNSSISSSMALAGGSLWRSSSAT